MCIHAYVFFCCLVKDDHQKSFLFIVLHFIRTYECTLEAYKTTTFFFITYILILNAAENNMSVFIPIFVRFFYLSFFCCCRGDDLLVGYLVYFCAYVCTKMIGIVFETHILVLCLFGADHYLKREKKTDQ